MYVPVKNSQPLWDMSKLTSRIVVMHVRRGCCWCWVGFCTCAPSIGRKSPKAVMVSAIAVQIKAPNKGESNTRDPVTSHFQRVNLRENGIIL